MITFPVGYHWKCVRGHCACAESRDPWVGGQKQLHFWNRRPRFAYSLCNFYWAMTTIKGRLLSSVTNAKALDCVNFLSVTLWPWPLTFWPWTVVIHGESLTNLATKYEDPLPIRSWVTSYNGSHWLALEMRTRPLRMRRITWLVSRESKTITYLESPTQICQFTVQLLLGYDDTIKGRLLSSHPMLKPFLGEKIVRSKWGPKMAVLGGNGGRNLRLWFRDPQKALPCAEPRRLTYFA